MAANEAAPRVALLARAGEACERITGALREAGAEVVLVADPLQAGPDEVRQATPQAILVALDPAIEDAIERYADVLADPGYMVIFEEAEQAAQRTGWDAARWLRHLTAKLHRHSDVLPAGAEAEESLLPTPGPLQSPATRVDYDEAIAAVTGEAQQLAGDVPRDSGIDGLTGLSLADAEPSVDAAPVVEAPAWDLDAGDVPDAVEAPVTELDASDAAEAVEAPAWDLDVEDLDVGEASAIVEAPAADGDAGDAAAALEAPAWDLDVDEASETVEAPAWDLEMGDVRADGSPAPAGDAEGAGGGAGSIAIGPLSHEGVDDAGAVDDLAFDPERFGRADQGGEAVGGIEEFLAAQLRQASPEEGEGDGATPAPVKAPDEDAPAVDFSGLSLADDDSAPAPAAQAGSAAPAFDLDRLGGGLSLADPDSYGHGPVRGAVVIEAGLGGPDAVRQLLAAIPEGFPRPILIRLTLDGGRYDRLVKQMTRATAAPVSVAEDGQAAQPGHVYFVPPELGLRQRGGWQFDASSAFDLAALPPQDSAVVFLSGADAALAAAVTGPDWGAGLVLGQTPDEGCYDPAGARAAIAAGAGHAPPAALAQRLLARWPLSDAAPDPDPSGMLQP